ncbi:MULTISPECIES: ABC transporter permease [Lysinibacillus]|uniref:Putative hemin transport system permease protein HrtB n=1 Tax=Lysinibacillus antri TaxID=2498145 RepID=A0A3S0R6K5_9BACI|nr:MULTISPECIES: ABC transporter permease [Lysinibacillus]RUL53535.1 FtsX-like permease family protein [Lysinibacillus antri]TSI06234.1 ABC transporter permease [Lysinibacillus sp. BW-2-10]
MFLAMKEMKHSKTRFVMIGAIIMLIAWLVFILSGLGNGLSSLAAATMKNIDGDVFIYEKGSEASMMKTKVSGSIADDIEGKYSVDEAAKFGQSTIIVHNENITDANEKNDVAFIGIEPDKFIEPTAVEGQQLNPNEKFGVLIDESLHKKGYEIGDTIVVTSSNLKLKVIGFTKGETFNHLPTIFGHIETWQSYAFAAPGSDNGLESPVSMIALQGENIEIEKIQDNYDLIETFSKSEAVMGMPGYKEESATIYMMLAFLFVISAVIIAVFFYVFILQKTQQFGVMKAIGASDRFIKNSIISQVFVLSLVSIIAGIALTYLTALALPEAMPFNLDFKIVLLYGVILLIVSVVGSVISARQVTKIDPLTAIGRVE